MSSTAFRGREHRRFTPEEYLLLEDGAEGRHEYFDSEIFAMTGGSLNHNRIAQNLCFALRDRLANGPCETFLGDVRIHIKSRGLFTYPDLFVACKPFVYYPGRTDTLADARLICEVLSPSTETYDRHDKFTFYRTLDSLETYILVAQDRPFVIYHQKVSSNEWLVRELIGMESRVETETPKLSLTFEEIYKHVEWL